MRLGLGDLQKSSALTRHDIVVVLSDPNGEYLAVVEPAFRFGSVFLCFVLVENASAFAIGSYNLM